MNLPPSYFLNLLPCLLSDYSCPTTALSPPVWVAGVLSLLVGVPVSFSLPLVLGPSCSSSSEPQQVNTDFNKKRPFSCFLTQTP